VFSVGDSATYWPDRARITSENAESPFLEHCGGGLFSKVKLNVERGND
jgi:hypothetical protein